MNKLTKATIAGATGIALLLGGAGSLAYWNATTSFTAGTITAGTLEITPGAGSWDRDIAHVVPGDSLVYTKTFEITAVGDRIAAEVSTNIDSITNGITGASATTTFALEDSDSAPVTKSGGVYSIQEGVYTLTATIEVDFPSAATAGQDGVLDLNNVSVTVQQVAN